VNVRAQLAREMAKRLEGLEMTCAGASMEPVVRQGEKVPVRPGRVRPGDVFVFVTGGGELEMHRLVVELPRGWLVHRGDNGARYGWTRVERVVGRCELPRRRPPARAIAGAIAASVWRAVHR